MGLMKITLLAYTDEELTAKSKEYHKFIVPINPESYSRSLKVKYENDNAQGTQNNNPKYISTESEKIKLEFVFDGTGTVEGYEESLLDFTVSEQIELFLNTVYFVDGEIHRPKFLKLSWGKDLVYDCILESVDINYTLFDSNAEPLRAKISASFSGFVESRKRVLVQDFRSTDLTHIRQVLASDKLTLMVHEIYGNSGFLTQVARANNLTSFRNLTVGNELIFPSVEKKSN